MGCSLLLFTRWAIAKMPVEQEEFKMTAPNDVNVLSITMTKY